MKKFICMVLALLMIVPCAIAEKAKELPQPDENGKTTYTGEIGWLFNEDGSAIKESLFDEAVRWIEEIPGVYDACIIVKEGEKYGNINLAIVVSPTPTIDEAKDIADSAIRQMGMLFGMTNEYEGPNAKSFGTLYDEYNLLVGVFTQAGKQLCLGAITSSWGRITW